MVSSEAAGVPRAVHAGRANMARLRSPFRSFHYLPKVCAPRTQTRYRQAVSLSGFAARETRGRIASPVHE